jgi:hypothetical protein
MDQKILFKHGTKTRMAKQTIFKKSKMPQKISQQTFLF